MTQTKTRALTEGALMVAAATALSYVKLLELPQGGSVCIGMLPIFLYCARWGCKESFLASFAYGLLQLIFDGNYAWGPTSMLFDYVLAYGVLGVACLPVPQAEGRRVHRHGRRLPVPLPRPLHQRHHDLPHL